MPKQQEVIDHWKTVVRDAFIDGRDDEAIAHLMANIVGWIAELQQRRHSKAKGGQSKKGFRRGVDFPETLHIIWDDDDDEEPTQRVMLVEEEIDGIPDGERVAIYTRTSIKTKVVVGTLTD